MDFRYEEKFIHICGTLAFSLYITRNQSTTFKISLTTGAKKRKGTIEVILPILIFT